jgi:predicted ATPase
MFAATLTGASSGMRVRIMAHDRITELRISGLRVIGDVKLPLSGLTVLIGDNGTGKSSILEALEILRLASKPVNHVVDVIMKGHGGLQSLLRRGAEELQLGVSIEGAGPRVDYDFAVANVGNDPMLIRETVVVDRHEEGLDPLQALARSGSQATAAVTSSRFPNSYMEEALGSNGHPPATAQVLSLPTLDGRAHPAVRRLVEALAHLDLQVPFEVRPLWQARELNLTVGPRWPAQVESTDRLGRFGLNLANAFLELRNRGDATWNRVLDRARLGLGADLRSFSLTPSGRGNIELEVVVGSMASRPLPAEMLSEGQLAYLAMIALCELHTNRSLLSFDEPEVHLHPALLARVLWMLEEVAESAPVILATHSDRLLDALEDPAKAVVLCELDEQRALRVSRPDANRLGEWLRDYRGIGELRSAGYEARVFGEAPEPGASK